MGSTEVIAARTMHSLHIWLDLAFLALLIVLLVRTQRYRPLTAGLIGAAIYFAADYGIFYKLLGTRVVHGASPFWFLLWLSASYGLTNFAWIWLWLDRDERLLEWSVFIIVGWLGIALMSQTFGYDPDPISISRGTDRYHGVMALLLFVGYLGLCICNVLQKDRHKRAPLLWILAIGILVQFSWETVLLISGIRNPSWRTLVVNSLLETNMGLPYLYLIHGAVTKRWPRSIRPRT